MFHAAAEAHRLRLSFEEAPHASSNALDSAHGVQEEIRFHRQRVVVYRLQICHSPEAYCRMRRMSVPNNGISCI